MDESQYLYGKIDSRNYELIIDGNYWSIYLFMGLRVYIYSGFRPAGVAHDCWNKDYI